MGHKSSQKLSACAEAETALTQSQRSGQDLCERDGPRGSSQEGLRVTRCGRVCKHEELERRVPQKGLGVLYLQTVPSDVW